jgi:ketosteroid isomerase-like protein
VAKAPAPAAAPVSAAQPPVAKAPSAAPAPAPAVTAAAPAPAAAPAAAPAPAPAAKAPAAAAAGNPSREVEAAVNAWATAWSSKDMAAYLGAYGREFDPPGNMSRKDWEEERRSRIVGKSRIAVRLSDLSVNVTGNKATAKFKQAYSADSLNVSSRKTLDLQKVGDRWVIVRENTGT